MKNLIRTLLGTVDVNNLRNLKLRRIIQDRIHQFSFLFNYGDSSEGHKDHTESARVYKEHSEKYDDQIHTDYERKRGPFYGDYEEGNWS